MLHETAHALISELDIPVFGHEEHAADHIATIALLHGTTDLGVPQRISPTDAVIAAAQAWRTEWELEELNNTQVPYWDNHPLDIQRFYDMMCLLYGSDPEQFQAVESQLGLPFQRAFSCADYEHEQARRAVTRTIEVYGSLFADDKEPGEVHVYYETPLNDELRHVGDMVKNAQIAEMVSKHLQRLATLPNDITIAFVSCLGRETAFWDVKRREIVMCYDLLERFLYLRRARSCLDQHELSEKKLESCLTTSRH